VAWDPTFSIYEASRDLTHARAEPAVVRDYLTPIARGVFQGLARQPRLVLHRLDIDAGIEWRQQYRIWMDCGTRVRQQGGPGHDRRRCRLYLFDVWLRHRARARAARGSGFPAARGDRARDLERRQAHRHGERLGKVREGFIADLLVVNGNPLENLKLLNPYGADVMLLNGGRRQLRAASGPTTRCRPSRGGGIEWTIKDGIPYHVPTLMREVKDMVTRARAQRVGPRPASQ
jgi:hypothetical protein